MQKDVAENREAQGNKVRKINSKNPAEDKNRIGLWTPIHGRKGAQIH